MMAEWGVKEAAQRLAKLLGARGRKCEVVEGDGDWPVGLVVDGTRLRMRQHVRRIARGMEGDAIKNVFDIVYAHQYVMISRSGKVDLDEIEKIVATRKDDDEKDARTEACRKAVAPIIAKHSTLINTIGDGGGGGGGGMVSTGKLVGVRLHDRHTSGTPGTLNITLDGTLHEMLPEDLEQLLGTLEEIGRRRNERTKAKRLGANDETKS